MSAIRYRNEVIFEKCGTFIYFIQMGYVGPIKIGLAKDPEKRVTALQVSSPYALRLIYATPGGANTEREIHREYNRYRIRGEWFHPCDQIFEDIEQFKKWDKRNTSYQERTMNDARRFQ